ncbi:unnamed protein product, partial [Symbiodinium sp. CCMP2592]
EKKWSGSRKGQETALNAHRTRLEMLQGILWPTQVYRRLKARPPKNLRLITVPWQGRQIKGYVLDETRGRPVGSVTIIVEDTRYIGKNH